MALVPTNVVDRARSQATQFYRGFTPGQKAVTLAAVVAAVIGGYVLMSMTGKPSYAPLFTNLQASDAATITSKLASAKIPYQLTNGGTTVMVPSNDVNQERVSLAQAGLPSGSTVGLSLLDKEGLTTSSISQQADYLQAIQGELEQTIDSISGVSSSQVNVALPANQDFALTNDAPTGASVLVTMQQGQQLSNGDVAAIVHLVSSSVPNLDSKNVTVADNTGNLLAGPGVTAGAGAGGDASSYDATTQAKVEAYLASVVGAGNADVQVNSALDYNQVSTTTNSIIAGKNGQPTSFCTQTSNTNETYSGAGAPATGGTAGTIIANSSSGTGNYKNTSTNQTCTTSTETQTVQQAPGTLKSQQVAVLVNSKAIPAGVNLSALQSGVAAAAGIQTARGDQLAFSTMPFNQTEATQAAAAAKAAAAANKSKAMSSLIRTGVVFFIIILVLFLIWRSSRKARVAPTVLSPSDIEQLRAARQLNQTTAMPVVSLPDVAPPVEQMTINHFIDSQPDDVANMLRSWLQDTPTKAHS
ncbi:MAG TPA: flagellar basal-body MS-ring/collar protein FliF [Acidimicrobiales bacterium]|jgi:flagellar M-ring protein FliF|nr:flagellar basal-body MS-ring/collar protein FliF [Acidimicrobiales bacterium]